jgi:preprotein translocase subunit SecA
MEFLDRIGEFFGAILAWFERLITRMFGASNDRMIARLGFIRRGETTTITPGSLLAKINAMESEWQAKSDAELKETATRFRQRLTQGESLDSLLPEAFAAVREAGRRFLKMRHYDTQLIGGYVLHRGMIAEMATGEGKTLVATLPAFLNALSGAVHVVTVNDYLARRDMEWMAPLYMGLGLTVGAIQSHQPQADKKAAYDADITYGTNNEFGFDYLRDNMKATLEAQVQGPLTYAIVDEIDNILIDEARTPLIISGPAEDDPERYVRANRIAVQLKRDVHFEVKEKEHSCHLTELGVRLAEELAGVESFYTSGNMEWPHLIDNALRAHHLYKRDVNYVVMQGEIIIVDEFTGRLMKGRQWSDGLHQAVEAKEGVKIKQQDQTIATITLQNFFKLYKKLSGMTGTAMTEASEFLKIYKLDVVSVPTNRPMVRINHPDVIFRTVREKYNAVVDEICREHETGRPILVGTTSIENSERVSEMLTRRGVKHQVLNAKYHEREADIIAQAGRLGAVTIATNMAGRGTDIILGGNPDAMAWDELKTKYKSRLDIPKAEWDEVTGRISRELGMAEEGREVARLGGLHVIGTERHEARRIDLQLRGRCARQGDPGSSRFFLSLEDDLMRIFAGDWVKGMLTRLGMQEGEAIESGMVSSRIQGAQKKVEERNFETRKNVLEYDEVMDLQRRRVYAYRQAILEGKNCRSLILDMLRQVTADSAGIMLSEAYGPKTVAQFARHELGLDVDQKELRGRSAEEIIEYLREESVRQAEDLLRERIEEDLPRDVEDERDRNWQAFSKWVNVRWGLNTNDRELKKIGLDGIFDELAQRAKEAVERADLSIVNSFLAEDFGTKQCSAWLQQKFQLRIDPAEFQGRPVDDSIDLIVERLNQLYSEKEVSFPVRVGLSTFLTSGGGSQGGVNDRDGLVRWASKRFHTELDVNRIRNAPRHQIVTELEIISRNFLGNGSVHKTIDGYLDQAYGESSNGASAHDIKPLSELAAWAQNNLGSTLTAEDLAPLTRDATRERVMVDVDARYRPELSKAERYLILEILDSAWKDHLYFMDHLRQGIGLVGYAQKDPKVEYKREAMRAFDQMWKHIADQVTTNVFRLEEANPEFLESLWTITSTRHDAPPEPEFETNPGANNGPQDHSRPNSSDPHASGNAPSQPIRNFGKRVGRNEPCPCGSGKKFKHCHGKR